MKGKITSIRPKYRNGWIKAEDGRDIFFSFPQGRRVEVDEEVEFEITTDSKNRPQAKNILFISASSSPASAPAKKKSSTLLVSWTFGSPQTDQMGLLELPITISIKRWERGREVGVPALKLGLSVNGQVVTLPGENPLTSKDGQVFFLAKVPPDLQRCYFVLTVLESSQGEIYTECWTKTVPQKKAGVLKVTPLGNAGDYSAFKLIILTEDKPDAEAISGTVTTTSTAEVDICEQPGGQPFAMGWEVTIPTRNDGTLLVWIRPKSDWRCHIQFSISGTGISSGPEYITRQKTAPADAGA